MQQSTRIAVNTIAQYIRTIFNVCLGLYSTRLVLIALGNEDYGIYMLVAGVVGMLSFVTNSLSITTQRFLSYEQGKKNNERLQTVFINSLFIHLILGLLIFLILEIVGIFLFEGALNIAPDRIHAAKAVYHFALVMIFFSILTSPYRASLIAHENLVFISVIDVIDGIWKVIIAILILNIKVDRLILYAELTVGIYLFSFFSFLIYTKINYTECKFFKLSSIDKSTIKALSTFAGWSLYSSGCIVGRNQGIAIVLNHFFGTVINASYGIAVQVSGAINFVASSLLMAFNPPITKAAGENNKAKMLLLSQTASKISLLLMCMVGIPLISRIKNILSLWLGEVPQSSTIICAVIIISTILDQLTSGLISTNRAIGKLKLYSLTVDTIKIMSVPFIAICLYNGVPLKYAIWFYAATELFSALTRFPILKQICGLNIRNWVINVFVKPLIPIIFLIFIYTVLSYTKFNLLLFIGEGLGISLTYLILCYHLSLSDFEKIKISKMLKATFKLIKR